MKKLFVSLLVSAAILAAPAYAKKALWFQGERWKVNGWTEGHCLAQAFFPDAGIGFSLDKDASFHVIISGMASIRGKLYSNTFKTGQLSAFVIGKSYNDETVTYEFTQKDILTLAYAKTLDISDVGRFDMTGSMEALSELMACHAAMNGKSA